MKPRRLLMISTDRDIFREGSPVRARQLEYAKQWDEVHIIVASGRSFSEMHLGEKVWAYPTRSRLRILYPFGAIRLGRFIAERRGITDITCQDPFLTALAGVSLKKRIPEARLEIQIHTDIGSPYFARGLANRFRKALALSQVPKADAVRVVSQRIAKYVTSVLGVSAAKVSVRPIAVDTEWIRAAAILPEADLRAKYPQFSRIALMASRLEPEKDIPLALRAWARLQKQFPKAGLVIVGKGSLEKKLAAEAKRLGIASSVVFLPWADRSALASYYKTADVFLSTSLFEGYGLTLVEAQAAGCAIASTDVGIASELPGAAIVEHDPASVADGLVNILSRSSAEPSMPGIDVSSRS